MASHAWDPGEKKGEKSNAEKDQRPNSCTAKPAKMIRLADVMLCRRRTLEVQAFAPASFTLHFVSGLIDLGRDPGGRLYGRIELTVKVNV